MSLEDETTGDDNAQGSAAFDAGFEGKTAEKPAAADKLKPAETPQVDAPAEPEYVQITKSDWADIKAAAMKTASYDQQLSKAFGTIGNLQKVVTALQGQTPRGGKIEISEDAFADMKKDFPELADASLGALRKALAGFSGTGAAEVDETLIERIAAKQATAREIDALEDEYPDWRKIVGAVDIAKEKPDPNNEFRKWLATKDEVYQARVNGSESAAVLTRAIRSFQTDTKAPAKPAAAPANGRADRIREAVQPKGDGAQAPPRNTSEEAFAAGFGS